MSNFCIQPHWNIPVQSGSHWWNNSVTFSHLERKENRAETLVTEEPKSTNDEQNKDDESNDNVCEDECQVTLFLRNTQLIPKETKPRKTLSKITSGKTITEAETFEKIKEFKEQSKGKSAHKPAKTRKHKPNSTINSKVKKPKEAKEMIVIDSQKPSTSIFSGAKGPLEDSIFSSDDDDDVLCCVCDQRYPPALRHCISLTIVNWTKFDACEHWTHLRHCSSVNVVRRLSEFVCPHTQTICISSS